MNINIDNLSGDELRNLQNQITHRLGKQKIVSHAEKQQYRSTLEPKIQECLKVRFPTVMNTKLNCQIEVEVTHEVDPADLEETLRQGNELEFDRNSEVTVKFIKFSGDEDNLEDLREAIEEAVINHLEYNYEAWEAIFPEQAKQATDAYAKWNDIASEVTEAISALGIESLEADEDEEHDERVDRELEMKAQDDEDEEEDEDDEEDEDEEEDESWDSSDDDDEDEDEDDEEDDEDDD